MHENDFPGHIDMAKLKSELVWDNNNEQQSLWIQIDSWWYKLFVESYQSHTTVFQFEGTISKGSGLTGLRILREIKVPTEVLYPDVNGTLPEDH